MADEADEAAAAADEEEDFFQFLRNKARESPEWAKAYCLYDISVQAFTLYEQLKRIADALEQRNPQETRLDPLSVPASP